MVHSKCCVWHVPRCQGLDGMTKQLLTVPCDLQAVLPRHGDHSQCLLHPCLGPYQHQDVLCGRPPSLWTEGLIHGPVGLELGLYTLYLCITVRRRAQVVRMELVCPDLFARLMYSGKIFRLLCALNDPCGCQPYSCSGPDLHRCQGRSPCIRRSRLTVSRRSRLTPMWGMPTPAVHWNRSPTASSLCPWLSMPVSAELTCRSPYPQSACSRLSWQHFHSRPAAALNMRHIRGRWHPFHSPFPQSSGLSVFLAIRPLALQHIMPFSSFQEAGRPA